MGPGERDNEERDELYAAEKSGAEPFRFDERVAQVFPDMLRRSIPGYDASLEAIGSLAARYVVADTRCYDLGCSLGGAALAMRHGIRAGGRMPGVRILAIDNAPAMVERCREIVARDTAGRGDAVPVEVLLADIRDAPLADASMVVMNYTLQFLSLADRAAIVERIAAALVPGGLFVLSEKVVDEDPAMEKLLVELHHEHKRRNAYSELEISAKRAALENVLVPETVAAHRARLTAAGFRHVAVWLRYFNFVSMIAIR
ncbi:MAG: carboxy-S-adenosyl-L-methionine synthase CmoA [Woeseiaceae bacterium]|nr:carboxy-S-adenosyl-L-methionine synthase CmoA [Woeseiaceae bacterium]